MAIDYRLRYYFAVTPPNIFTARMGASRLLTFVPEDGRLEWLILVAQLFDEIIASITGRLAPVGRRLGDSDEKELCQVCYLLGLLEEAYRAPPQYVRQSRLLSLHSEGGPRAEDLLTVDEDMGVHDDLARLSHAFFDTQGALIGGAAVLNPVFAGSGDVGGADADLIVDGCLIEIKTTVGQSRLERERLYQLLGYVLLDYDDAHQIRSLGIYFTRHAALVRWPLEDFLELLAGESVLSVEAIRDQLRSALR